MSSRLVGGERPRADLSRRPRRPAARTRSSTWLAVREAATLDQARTGKPLDKLREQARLADAGGAEERDELWRAFALDASRDGTQDRKLLVSPDQRRAQAPDAAWRRLLLARRGDRHPGRDGRALSLRLDWLVLAIRDRAARRRLRPLSQEHLARIRVLLQARGHVDRVAADHQLATGGRLAAGDHFARVDADPQPDVGAVAALDALGERSEAVPHGQRRPNRPLGVVLVGLGDAEHGEDRVAGEFLRGASEPLDLGVDQLEELPLELAHVLRVQFLAERGRAREVGEQDGDNAPLLAIVGRVRRTASVFSERDAAGRAEGRAGRLLEPAGRADPLKRRATLTAEAGPAGALGSAGSADQSHAPSLRRRHQKRERRDCRSQRLRPDEKAPDTSGAELTPLTRPGTVR